MKIYEIDFKKDEGKTFIDNEGLTFKLKDNELKEINTNENIKDMYNLNGLFNHIELKEIKLKLKGWEQVKKDDRYYYIHINGIEKYKNYNDNIDKHLFNIANYFSTKEKAEEVNNEQKLYRLMKRFRDMNDTKEIDWNNINIPKYYIYQDMSYEKYYISFTNFKKQLNAIYFSDREVAQRCIDEIVIPFYENLNKENQVEEDNDYNIEDIF